MILERMLMAGVMVLLTHGLFAAAAYIQPVVTLQGQFRIQWTKNPNAVEYKVYSYRMPLSHRPSIGNLDPDVYDTPRTLCGTTTNDYFIVFAQGYYKPNVSDPYTFRVVGVDKKGDDLDPNAAPETIHYPSGGWYNCDAEGDGERKYRLKGSQNITQGSTGKVVMEYGFGDSPQVWMETWDQTIIWRVASGGDFVTLEDVNTTVEGGKLFHYSARYGVTVRAKDNVNLSTAKTVVITGTIANSVVSAELKIRILPTVTVNFWANHADTLSANVCKYADGKSYGSLPVATRNGYTFSGWYTADGVRVDEATIVSTQVTDLYARWAITEPWTDGKYVDHVDAVTWRFSIENGCVTIDSVDDNVNPLPACLNIPDTLGKRPVTAIDDWAFYNRAAIETVTIPSSVRRIGDAAFYSCENLTSVEFKGNDWEITFGSDGTQYHYDVFGETPFGETWFCLIVNECEVVGYHGTVPADLVIPDGVTSIGAYVFYNESCWDDEQGDWVGKVEALESVSFPASLEAIGDAAFFDCSNLTNANFATNPLEIDIAFNAFSGTPFNSKLFRLEVATASGTGLMGYCGFRGPLPENLVLPNDNDLPCIFIWAFSYQSGLKEITIPASIGYLYEYAFEGCENLMTVRFKGPPPYGIEMSRLLKYATKVYYPEKFENEWRHFVDDNLFAGYEESDYLIVWFDPADLGRRTGGGQLRQAVKYGEDAVAPILQAEIGWKFQDWDADFTDVTSNMMIRARYQAKLPNEPFEDGEYSLEVGDCTWRFIVSAGKAELIDDWHADWPMEVCIPETLGNCPVTSVGRQVFAWKSGICSISIPKTVTAIDPHAFQACESLRKIEVDTENPAFCSIDGIVYSKDMNRLVVAPAAKVLVVVPDGVSEIGDSAFSYSKALQSVHMPKGMTNFGDYAFAYCQNLTNVTFEGDLPDHAGHCAFEPDWQGSSSLTMRYPLTNETWDPLPDSEYWDCYSRKFKYVGYAGEYVRLSAQETEGLTLAVEPEWFDAYPTLTTKFGENRKDALSAFTGKQSANGRNMQVWEDYVAGTNPTNMESRFSATVEMKNGQPLVRWTPDLNENGAKMLRAYKIWGKESLDEESPWQCPTNALHRFFKVTVEMP